MPAEMLWNLGLTAALGFVSWVLKSYAEEVKRLQILLNRTREEVAKEYVTKAEVHADINRVLARIDAMDNKIDNILQRLAK
jgi:archaellum component FlaC